MRTQVLALFGLVASALVLVPATVAGHAQYDPFSINRFTEISFAPGALVFTYDLTVGDLPGQQIKVKADSDRDGLLSDTEVRPLVAGLWRILAVGVVLQLDGQVVQPVPGPWSLELVHNQVMVFAPIRFRFRFQVPCATGAHSLLYHDSARVPGVWQTEVLVQAREGVDLLQVSRPPAEEGIEARLFWNQGDPPTPVRVRFVVASSLPSSDKAPEDRPLLDDGGPLKRALADERLGLWGTLAMLGLAFLLGAAHALSPGHGKAVVAAFLVGNRGTVGHAVALGIIVTATHVISVVILGVVALWASSRMVPELLAPWLSLVSGALVLALGAWMVAIRFLNKPPAHPHPHPHPHEHVDSPAQEGSGYKVRWAQLLVLGISGGMVPCVSATVVLLFAVYLGKILLGLVLILAFSLGLSVTLIVLGVLVVRGRRWLERWSTGQRGRWVLAALPLASAAAVTILGALMTLVAALAL